jgi:hypothetical protein
MLQWWQASNTSIIYQLILTDDFFSNTILFDMKEGSKR